MNEEPAPEQASSVRAGLRGHPFWMLCTMEMWERLAYYGVRVVMPVYIAQADEVGGLHFTQEDKGTIYAWWFIFQSVLPSFTGGFADRYGYKKNLIFAITLKVLGYLLMATQRTYGGFFFGVALLAIGTAQFKPAIQGSISQTLRKSDSSVGWGVFYWLVNVGAVIGPYVAGVRQEFGWPGLFYCAAAIVSLNYLMLFTYPTIHSGASVTDRFDVVFYKTIRNLLDGRLITFLLILSGFWLMMYQLWDTHPNFLTDWNDSSGIAAWLPSWMTHDTERGRQVLQEQLLNLNAAMIVLFMVPVSWLVRRLKTLQAMIGGMTVATMGILVAGLTSSGTVFLLGVVFFSLGEMLTGPKKNEYLSLIAPEGKKALYLGYVNIPVGIGGYVGSKLSGYLYGRYAEKATLAQRYLVEHTDYLEAHGRPAWDGDVTTLGETLGVGRTEAYATLVEVLGQTPQEVTDLLWTTYQPWTIWYVFAAIGVVSTISLVLYTRAARRWKDLNV
jgi:dipeptide/tripeptide permease